MEISLNKKIRLGSSNNLRKSGGILGLKKKVFKKDKEGFLRCMENKCNCEDLAEIIKK